eukprot:gene6333-2959_t
MASGGNPVLPPIRRTLNLILMLALAMVPPIAFASDSLACEQSGYCSLGKISPFLGDVASSEQLKNMLDSCSYKKEVILLASTSDVLDNALQTYNQFIQLGLAHVVLLAPDEGACHKASDIASDLCCVWNSVELPGNFFPHQLKLWHIRRRVTARAVRLGYNFMVVDTDVIIFDDPYNVPVFTPLLHLPS